MKLGLSTLKICPHIFTFYNNNNNININNNNNYYYYIYYVYMHELIVCVYIYINVYDTICITIPIQYIGLQQFLLNPADDLHQHWYS